MKLMVSPYLVISWSDGDMVISSTTSDRMLRTKDSLLLLILHAFSLPKTEKEVMALFLPSLSAHVEDSTDTLMSMGALIEPAAMEDAASNGWDSTALAFHRRSRHFQLPQIPGIGVKENEGALEGIRPLSVPNDIRESRHFLEVLDRRRSSRSWQSGPISFGTLSAFFWFSCRNRHQGEVGNHPHLISRPYPSGGAVYSLQVYLVAGNDAVVSVKPGIYRYLPDKHALEHVSSEAAVYASLLELAGDAAGVGQVPMVLLVTSKYSSQSHIYGELAYSLILKEVGCLFQTFYLVAEYLGLGACALGGGIPYGLLSSVFITGELSEPLVGEFILHPGTQFSSTGNGAGNAIS